MIALAAVSAEVAHGWLADLSQTATGSLVAAIWQGVLLAAAAALGLRLLKKTPAAVRFAIWFGVFLLVAALPILSLWPHAAGAAGGDGAWITLDARWCLAIAAVWAAASLVRAVTLVIAAFRVRALWQRATPVGTSYRSRRAAAREVPEGVPLGPAYDEGVVDWARQHRRRAEICTSDEVDRPTVIGFFSPKILIPDWLLDVLSPAELEQIVLHERGHLGRADDWMNLLQKIALVVFPLNPALAWVERRLCFERELAVDERVLQATGAPKAYAACLATLAEHRLRQRGLTLVLGALGRDSHLNQQAGWGPRSELGRRVARILRRGEHMKPLHARLVMGGAVLALLVAATGLARCPQVVGFSAAGNEAAGVEQAAAVSKPLAGYRAQAVILRMNAARPQEWKSFSDSADVALKPLVKSAVHSNAEVKVKGLSSAATAVDVAQKTPANPVDAMASQTAENSGPAQEGDLVITQTVVTSLGDGSRVVLTTSQILRSAPQVEQDSDGSAPQEPSQEMHPYAAVPVRGGWLVFQL